MAEHHKCARCGVADEDVIWSGNDAAYLHSAYVDCTSSDQCIAALKRENAALKREVVALREREEKGVVAVGFAQWAEDRGGREQYPMWKHDPYKCIEEAFAAFRKSDEYPK